MFACLVVWSVVCSFVGLFAFRFLVGWFIGCFGCVGCLCDSCLDCSLGWWFERSFVDLVHWSLG